MGSQSSAKTAPLATGASNPSEGQSALTSLMGQPSSSGQPTASGGGQDDQLLQKYLQSLLGSAN